MTVQELIRELEILPRDKQVKFSTKDTDCGFVIRAEEYLEYVVLENDDILYKEGF